MKAQSSIAVKPLGDVFNSEGWLLRRKDEPMSPHSLMLTILLIAMAVIYMWRQLLILVTALVFIIFCIGLQHFIQIIHA